MKALGSMMKNHLVMKQLTRVILLGSSRKIKGMEKVNFSGIIMSIIQDNGTRALKMGQECGKQPMEIAILAIGLMEKCKEREFI